MAAVRFHLADDAEAVSGRLADERQLRLERMDAGPDIDDLH
jgi:hypothetical protein